MCQVKTLDRQTQTAYNDNEQRGTYVRIDLRKERGIMRGIHEGELRYHYVFSHGDYDYYFDHCRYDRTIKVPSNLVLKTDEEMTRHAIYAEDEDCVTEYYKKCFDCYSGKPGAINPG